MAIKTLNILGTRPDAIKLAPVIMQLDLAENIDNYVCSTGQHQQMLDSVLEQFDITPNYSLDAMAAKQSLAQLTSKILTGLNSLLEDFKPDLILVHGDTTTTLSASLAAYYNHIPIAHVEAGLRTGNNYSPWPEEVNRKLTGSLASLHFAPTEQARLNLLSEGILDKDIFVTGNTVIDALYQTRSKIDSNAKIRDEIERKLSFLKNDRQLILVTGHRRENFGIKFKNICDAIRQVAEKFPDVDIVYPVHLNPNVQDPVYQILGDIPNVYLIEPVDYTSFVVLMQKSYFILTDSGGIQEEAPSLGKPVLVMRDMTERPEAIDSGTVQLVGSDTVKIVNAIEQLLIDEHKYSMMSRIQSTYGDGMAAARIVKVISQMNDKPPTVNSTKRDVICDTEFA